MNKIPTAEEFLVISDEFETLETKTQEKVVIKAMIEFAKSHVKTALQEASKKAYVEFVDLTNNEIFDYTDIITDDDVGANVNKNSILNSYSLENIK